MDFWELFSWRIAQILGFTSAIFGLFILWFEPLLAIERNTSSRSWVFLLSIFLIVFGLALGFSITEYL